MQNLNYTEIGHTLKAHGVAGEIKVSIKEDYLDDFDAAKVLFLKIKGQLLPYFVTSIRSPNTPIVKFDDVNHREAAKAISFKSIYLRTSDIIEKAPISNLKYNYCIGFEIEDSYEGKIGTVKEILEYPQQEIAVVIYKGKEVLIPLNDHLITTINIASKLIKVELPEGMLDIE